MNDGKNEQQNDVFLEPISPFKINQKQQPNRAGLLDIITAESKGESPRTNWKCSICMNINENITNMANAIAIKPMLYCR